MASYLDGTGLGYLIGKIKAAFVAKADTTTVTSVGIDSTPTENSTNLVTSGGVKSALDGKQATLSTQTAYTSKGSATKVPQITTNTLGQVTGITEVTITQPSAPGTLNTTATTTQSTSSSEALSGSVTLHKVSKTGSYNDLLNKPTIPTVPTNVSAFTNDAGYLTSHQDISGKVDKVSSATSGDLAGLDSNGNLTDSGVASADIVKFSPDNGSGIVPEDGIRVETVSSGATISVNPDVVTVISGAVGTAAITLQVPSDSLAHVWDILMTTDSTVSITFAMSDSTTIKVPSGFTSPSASKSVEISVIGTGTTYYLRYGEFA